MQPRHAVRLSTFSQRPAAAGILPSPREKTYFRVLRRFCSSPLVALDLWHLLSLDAPTVAVTWLLFAGSCVGVPAQRGTAAALFLAVWAVYAVDRLLDAGALPRFGLAPRQTPRTALFAHRQADLELRHHFHHRHRKAFWIILVGLGPVLAYLLPSLPSPTLMAESALAILLAGWLLRVHRSANSQTPQRLPKEFVVGLFFSLAIYLPYTHRIQDKLSLLPGAVLFAGLCTANCLFLYAWEHPHDLSGAHPATAFAVRRLVPLALIALFASAFAWFPLRTAPLGEIPVACALSTALLLVLHANRQRFSPLRLRALADLVLLSPLLIALARRLGHWHPLAAHL